MASSGVCSARSRRVRAWRSYACAQKRGGASFDLSPAEPTRQGQDEIPVSWNVLRGRIQKKSAGNPGPACIWTCGVPRDRRAKRDPPAAQAGCPQGPQGPAGPVGPQGPRGTLLVTELGTSIYVLGGLLSPCVQQVVLQM